MRSLSKWMLKAEALNSRPPSLRLSSLVTAESCRASGNMTMTATYMATWLHVQMTSSESGDLTWPKIIMCKSKLVTYAYWNRFKISLLHTNSHQKSYSTSIHLLLASSQTAAPGPTEFFCSHPRSCSHFSATVIAALTEPSLRTGIPRRSYHASHFSISKASTWDAKVYGTVLESRLPSKKWIPLSHLLGFIPETGWTAELRYKHLLELIFSDKALWLGTSHALGTTL